LWGRRRRRLLSRWSLRRCVHLRSRVRDRRWRWLRRSRALRKNKIWWSWLRAVGRTSRDRSGWRRLFAGRGLFGSWCARRRRFAARQPWRDSSRRRRFLSCGWLLRPGCRWRNRFTARRCRQSARRTTGFDRRRSARTTGRSHTNKIRRNEFVPGRRSIRWNTRSSFDGTFAPGLAAGLTRLGGIGFWPITGAGEPLGPGDPGTCPFLRICGVGSGAGFGRSFGGGFC
jgi:hypothetical protein